MDLTGTALGMGDTPERKTSVARGEAAERDASCQSLSWSRILEGSTRP